jgi:uroporphyrin-III C-methyltransferase/precorrin-2 dehydrogenase/sirohydrochlorin ferrochelatase
MRHLPIFMTVAGRPVLIAGGTAAAARKADLAAGAGARVTVVAADGSDEMRDACRTHAFAWHRRRFEPADVAGVALAIVDTGDRGEDARISAAAQAAGVPVNVVDAPALSTFIMGAIVDRDPLTVAISSAGTAPVLARRVRARIEALLPANLGRLALFAERFRSAVAACRPDGRARRRFWERFFTGPVAARVLAGNETGAADAMIALINRPDGAADAARDAAPGLVSIVGAGPGDPDLLTLKAARALEDADVIVYDRLVGRGILERGRRDADRIFVGKRKGSHASSQEAINRLLAEKARAGLRVVRLKGGDPFIFGRGGEERRHLLALGIPVEVVPGITAALGCAAAAGIPLTDRGRAQTLTLATGHGAAAPGAAPDTDRDIDPDIDPDIDWRGLAAGNRTLALYMGASRAGHLAARLIAAGAPPGLPVAVIVDGTRPDGRVVTGRLAGLEGVVAAACAGPGGGPVLIIAGEVVRDADAWSEVAPARASA